ncbi:STAS domain-containing protein [Solirubrobacter sp. CPCC 204708]|uniref:Anti-sigma factor antagonist n=1 Tax=Solirubrobacter deserti TaxID=2282478 RepID=A0ABT4RQZ5_9ACTN|nr:STAS domain-containing protein [Solirubrobacter deserti]MBE2320072.1 STAS domain-containing protein [Solirubrobacter deserti]MDA0140988.1 STAS domain-containing protein [Solirubrobacter deserti]
MPDDFAPKPFRCEVSHLDGTASVRPEGDLDMSTVDDVEHLLDELLRGGAKQIVVDLRGLSFMDSTGITLLTRWNNAANRDGFDLALIQGEDRIARLFTLTGLHEYFTFVAG